MKRVFSVMAVALVCAVLASAALVTLPPPAAEAAGNTISIDPLPQIRVGDSYTVVVKARMLGSTRKAVSGARLRLLIDGTQVGSGVTGSTGYAQLKFRPELGAGSHKAKVVFDGSRLLGGAASASRTFTVLPAEASKITIDPLPELQLGQDPSVTVVAHMLTASSKPVAGERLLLKIDGVKSGSGVTDSKGTARLRFRIPLDVGDHKVEVSFDGTTGIKASTATSTLTVQPPSSTTVTVDSIAPLRVGEEAQLTVVAHLADANGNPVPNGRLQLYVEGEQVIGGSTDGSGTVRLRFRREFTAGSYQVEVKFDGSRTLAGSSGSQTIQVNPATLVVQVVPAIPGARVLAEGKVFTSGDDGVINVELSKVGAVTIEALPFETDQPGMSLKFARWSDEVFTPQRDVLVPLTGRLQLGYDTSYQVGLSYVDPDGNEVPLSRITSARLSSSVGSTHTFKPGELQWLQGSRIVRRSGGLEETRLLYSLESVVIDGSNVVNAKEQRFYLEPNLNFRAQLLLYDARISAQDAVLGVPIGKSVSLQYPDGRKIPYELGNDGSISLSRLPRGEYRVTIDAPGISFTTPVALSRSQDVDLKVISYLDLGVGIALLAALAIGLLLIGRPHLARVRIPSPSLPFRRRAAPQEQ